MASHLLGLTGRRIIEAMIGGENSPALLSWKVKGKLRKKEKQVKESLKGCFNEFHRMMLKTHYALCQFLTRQVEELEAEIARRMQLYADQVNALATIPGVERITVWHLVAELGADMSVFPDADHCASWAGLSPGSCESAGKQLSTRTRKGNKYLRRILTQSAWAVSHCKQGYLRAFFHRVKARRGWARAIIAVAHKILVIAYCVLKTGAPYQDLGGDYLDKLHAERTARRLVRRLERLGLTVSVTPSEPANPAFQMN